MELASREMALLTQGQNLVHKHLSSSLMYYHLYEDINWI